MKPTNAANPPMSVFWCLIDQRGAFYAYSDKKSGVRCADDLKFARKYGSRRGAWVAQENINRAYGKRCDPVKVEAEVKLKVVR